MDTLTLFSVMGLLSGVVAAAFGAWLLTQPDRPRGAFAFGLFAAAWGAQVVGSNAEILSGHAPGRAMEAIEHALLMLLAPLLVAFLVTTGEGAIPARRRALVLAPFGVAAAGTVLFLARRDWFIQDTTTLDATAYPSNFGPAALLLGAGPFYAALAALSLVALRRMDATRSPLAARQWVLLAAAALVHLGYAVPFYGLRFASAFPEYLAARGAFETTVHAAIFILSAVAIATAAARVRRARRLGRAHRRLLAAAVIVPVGLGVLSTVPLAFGAGAVGLFGLTRIVFVATIALAIFRHRLFDVAASRSVAPLAACAIASGFAIVLAFEQVLAIAGTSSAKSPALAAASGALFVASVAAPVLPGFREASRGTVAAVFGSRDLPTAQRLELYGSAVEATLAARGRADGHDPELAALRKDLGLDAADHDRVAVFALARRASSGPAPTRAGLVHGPAASPGIAAPARDSTLDATAEWDADGAR